MRMVSIGDSLIYGYGVRREEVWSSLLSCTMPDMDIINRGVSGDTTTGIRNRFEREALMKNPDIVFLMGGSNDIFFYRDSETAKRNIQYMESLCRGRSTRLFLGVPISVNEQSMSAQWAPVASGEEVKRQLMQYCIWLRAYGGKHRIPLLDFEAMLEDNSRIRNKLYLDGVHLTPLGHQLMAKYIEKKLAQWL